MTNPDRSISSVLQQLSSNSDVRSELANRLSHRSRIMWACDCVEQAADQLDDVLVESTVLSAIQTTRAWVEGEATSSEVNRASYATGDMSESGSEKNISIAKAAYFATRAVSDSSSSSAYAAVTFSAVDHAWLVDQALDYIRLENAK